MLGHYCLSFRNSSPRWIKGFSSVKKTSLIFHFLAVVLLLKFYCLRLDWKPEFLRKLHKSALICQWNSDCEEVASEKYVEEWGVQLLGLSPSLQPATYPWHGLPFIQSSPEINLAVRFAWLNMCNVSAFPRHLYHRLILTAKLSLCWDP